MSDSKTPSPEPPEAPSSWIAPLVRSIMNRPPIVETAGPLRCPTCGCDHQQFRGLGIFRPTDDGTKLLAVFPTADTLTTIDLPEDVKVGTTIYYVRYVCLHNGHHWADVKAYYSDHTATWCVQLADEPSPATTPPGVAAMECQKHKPVPQHAAMPAPIPSQPLSGLAGYVQSLASNPVLTSLTGGQMLPILVLPVPVSIPGPVLPPPQIAETVPKSTVHTGEGTGETSTEESQPKVIETPGHADAFWLSWNKKMIGGKTEILLPILPVSKGPHFYVADRTPDRVKERRDWVMRMALDVPKDVAKLVWAYILWHDRLLLVLTTSTVTPAISKRILEGIKESLITHDSIKVHGVVMYKKDDYLNLTK